jgi:hypothetical protein
MERRHPAGQRGLALRFGVGQQRIRRLIAIRRIGRGWSSRSGRVRLFLRRAAWEVPVMTGPDEGGLAGRGHLRAAQADREQAITVLKAAYAHGRLTKDELEARAGQAFASRTYAELAALTADLPTASPAVASPAVASRAATGSDAAWPRPSTPARTMAKAARRSGVCLLVAVALVEGAYLAGNFLLIVAAFFALIAASGFFGYGIIDAWQERRAHAQLPPGPGRRHQGSEGRLPGDDAAPTGISPPPADGTRADSRAQQPGPDRRHPSRRGVPVPVRPHPWYSCAPSPLP